MPTYDYRCPSCGRNAERALPITLAPDLGTPLDAACPCGGVPLRVMSSTPPVIADAALAASRKYPYVSRAHSAAQLKGVNALDPAGHPIIESAAHEREVAARSDMVRD